MEKCQRKIQKKILEKVQFSLQKMCKVYIIIIVEKQNLILEWQNKKTIQRQVSEEDNWLRDTVLSIELCELVYCECDYVPLLGFSAAKS